MTREEKLYSMRMQELVMVADKLGIKINTKAAKSAAIEKILAAEEMNKQNEKELAKEEAEAVKIEEPKLVPMPGTEDPDWGKKHFASDEIASDGTPLAEVGKEIAEQAKEKAAAVNKPKRGAKIEYNGKSQNICAWAKELGVSANTLYSRIYILGWDVEKAFTYKRS